MKIDILNSAGATLETVTVDEDNNHVVVEFIGGSDVGTVEVVSRYNVVEPMDIRIDYRCTPSHPFYVRWINDLGGWEYQMTHERKVVTKSRDVETEFVRKDGTTKHINIIPEERVSCGVSTDSVEWAQALANMIYSPKIQYYDTYTAAWIDVTLDDSQRTVVNRPFPATDFEFVFVCPRRTVQF